MVRTARPATRFALVMTALVATVVASAAVSAAPAAASQSAPAGYDADLIGSGPDGGGGLGQMLTTRRESLPDGVVQVTEFEHGTTVVGVLSGCHFSATPSLPYRSGSRIYSRVTFSVTGCSSIFDKIHVLSDGPRRVKVSSSVWRAPVSSAVSWISISCRTGNYATELSLDTGSDFHYVTSSRRRISC